MVRHDSDSLFPPGFDTRGRAVLPGCHVESDQRILAGVNMNDRKKYGKRFEFDLRLGMYIKECRKMMLLSQRELAKEIGCATHQISDWECGDYPLKLNMFMKLRRVFLNVDIDILKNVEVLWLMCGDRRVEKRIRVKRHGGDIQKMKKGI